MPLKQGSSDKTRSQNIAEIERAYKASGKIGNSTPKSDEAAQKQAEAIAYATQRKNQK